MNPAKIRSILTGVISITVGLGTLGVPYAADAARIITDNAETVITVGFGVWSILAGRRKADV